MKTYSNHPIGMLPDVENFDPNTQSIPAFYSGRDIFITGGSGFMGKVLIEKLLRSCPDLNNIYILIREKKQKSVETRIKDIQDLPLFETLKLSNPNQLSKMIPVTGDVTQLGLGLSDADLKKMENVSIVFHVAASVRFDDPLKYAILLNTRGTREVVRLAETMKNLTVLMHVSTTYSNPDHHVIEERIYPPYSDWREAIKIAETLNTEVLDAMAPKYMSFMPNTYTFTKSLGEQIINDHKDKLPIVLFRPSIVISTMKDPIPGWIDNFNGPIGLLIGSGIGITRTLYCDPNNIADFTPVDVCIKAMIVAAWKRGTKAPAPGSPALTVYNCSTSNQRNCTMNQIIDIGKLLTTDTPLDKLIWAPGGGLTQSRLRNYIRVILYQIIPAIVIDAIFNLTGRKPFLTNLQRRIYMANCALEYFILNNWEFKNDNFLSLTSEIKPEDNKDFYYRDFIEFDIILYFRNCILGARRYLLKENDADLPRARKNFRRMKALDVVVKTFMLACVLYFFLIKQGWLVTISNFSESPQTYLQKFQR